MIEKQHIRRTGVPPVSGHGAFEAIGGNPPPRFNVLTNSAISNPQSAFTLIEMLTVISIIGILAALSVPVLKNFGKADTSISASRQLLADIGYARQLAMSQRTTVYMVFVPTNFWAMPGSPATQNTPWMNALTATNELPLLTNLLDKQLTGYTYLAYGALGDQPGQHTWHYLAPWQALPEGTYIAPWKFYNFANPGQPFNFSDPAANPGYPNPPYQFSINAFSVTNVFPFPTTNITASLVENPPYNGSLPYLPYIAFNYLGQLCTFSGQLLTSPTQGQDFDQDFTGGGVDIPLVQGSVIPSIDPNTRALEPNSPGVIENPPGNGTNITYNVVHIDPLTGRATLEYHKMQ